MSSPATFAIFFACAALAPLLMSIVHKRARNVRPSTVLAPYTPAVVAINAALLVLLRGGTKWKLPFIRAAGRDDRG